MTTLAVPAIDLLPGDHLHLEVDGPCRVRTVNVGSRNVFVTVEGHPDPIRLPHREIVRVSSVLRGRRAP